MEKQKMVTESKFARYLEGSLEFGEDAKRIPYQKLGKEYSEEQCKFRLGYVKDMLHLSERTVKESTYDVVCHDIYRYTDEMDFVLMVRIINLTMKGKKTIRFRFVTEDEYTVLYYPPWMAGKTINKK